jgi:hypothetical protein
VQPVIYGAPLLRKVQAGFLPCSPPLGRNLDLSHVFFACHVATVQETGTARELRRLPVESVDFLRAGVAEQKR